MEDAEAAALAVLSKRSFDRTPEEVQQLAAWLVATCQPFFSSMRPDVVQHLCAHVGHAWVDEAQPVYTQGQIGDRMFITVKGYCSVLKHAEAASTAAATTTMADNSGGSGSGGSPVTSSSRRGTGSSQPVSRKATVEMQTQQFALATGAVGLSTGLSSRRGTAEAAVGSGAGGTARRVSGAVAAQQVGSRRVTAEQVVQQRLAESAQLGWLSRGDSFGEAALVNPSQQRPVSVVAGDEGVMLLVLDRACFSRLQQQVQEGTQPLAAAAVQAVLAAACRPLLRVGGRGRTAEEVQALAELFSGLEAFKCMPPAVRSRLAKACQGLQLPPGALVFEEDDKGDAMYVVVAGCLQVRARPLNTDPNLAAAAAAGPQPQQQEGAQEASACGGAQSCSGGSGGQQHKQRATTDAMCAGPERSHWGVGGGAGVGVGAPYWAQVVGSRRTTWEGVAFTAKEQARLDQVRSLLETEKLQEGMLLLLGGSATSSTARVVTDKGDRQAGGSLVERDGLYWTAKFMSDAAAAATSSDPQWGLEGGMTPLAAVFASKWRQQVRQQAAVHHAQTAAAEEEAADSLAYAAMEEMLGKAAAKAWKAARDNAAALASAATAGTGNSSAAGSGSSCKESLTAAGTSCGGDAAAQGAGRPVGCDEAAVAAATVVAGGSSSIDSETSDNPDSPTAAAAPEGVTPDSGDSSAGGAGAAAGAAAAESAAVPCSPRTAAAAAAQLLAAAAAASDPVEAVKLHLAALGVKDPADVSRTLMAEVRARSNLEGLLQAVAGFLEKKGLPQRLNKKSSLKITRELNKRMLAGASWKGYSGTDSSSSQGSSFNSAMRSSHQQQQQQAPGAWGDAASASAAAAAGGGSEGDLLGAEATGLSSCDWQSSLVLDGGSDGVSMYGGGVGIGPEDSMEGSLVGNSFDLAASTGTCTTGVGPVPAGVHWQQQQQGGEAVGAGGEGVALTAGLGGSFSCRSCGCHQRQQGASMEGGVGDAALAGSLQAGGCCPCCCARTGEQQRRQQQQQLPALQVPSGAKGATGSAAGGSVGSGGCLTARFGPVIRALGTGDSFGELALLQCRAVRTATVVVEPNQTDEAGGGAGGGGGGAGSSSGGGGGGALLIKISRSCYDATVRALQVSALEELLCFLASLPVFRGLSREVLTSLAVFMRPLDAQPGQVLALGGQAADALLIIQTGEVKLLAPVGGRTPSGGSGSNGSIDGSSSLARSNGGGSSSRQLGRQASNPAGVTGAGGSSSSSSSGGGLSRPIQQQQPLLTVSGLQLAVLGPGSLLGENLLGYNADEDPVAAVAAAPSRRARQAAAAAAAGLTHHATAVVGGGAPARLLVVSADDLRRFGRRVRGPLAEAAAMRREWLAARLAAVQVPYAPQGLRTAPVLAAVEKRERFGRRTAAAGSGSTSVHASGDEANRGSAAFVSAAGPRQGGSQGAAPAGNSSTSVAGLWPGLASLLRGQGSSMVHGSSSSSPAAAAAASRAQWQQQQWQRDAYGELLQQQSPTSSAQQQQQQQQQLCVGDVARLRQVVPGSAPPCVSELAAAARPFPAGLLTASAVAAAGRDGAKGLRQLLQLVPATEAAAAATAAAAGSPKWSVGAGGRVLPAGGGGVEGAVPVVSGRRAPMARHLERDSEQ